MRSEGRSIRPLGERRSTGDVVADRLREAILNGVYSQGERISDSRIAEELGTSRGPVREALKLLAAEGLVLQKPHRGTFVTSVSADDVRDICELRVALESQAARALARGHTKADLSTLRRLVDTMDRAVVRRDGLAVSQADKRFHESLCELGGSPRLLAVYEREVSSVLSFFGFDAQAYQPLSQMSLELRPLLAAVEAADEEEAGRLIEAHIRRATGLLADAVQQTQRSPTGD